MASHKCGLIDTVGHEAGYLSQALTCPDSFLWQDPSFKFVGHVRAFRPNTAEPTTSFASFHGILGTADAEKVP